MEWIDETEIEDDSDDENEIRQLDAVLGEAAIEVCDTGLPKPQKLHYAGPATDNIASPHTADLSKSALPLDTTLQTASSSDSELIQDLQDLDELLAINKEYEEKLRRLEMILGVRLKECRAKLEEIQQSNTVPEKVETFRYINCGRPYFRDNLNYPAPENDDAITIKSQMYDFSLVTSVPGWTVRDKNQFTNVMSQVSLDIRKHEYNKKISDLKKLQGGLENKIIEKEIEMLRKQRDKLNIKMPFSQLALPLNQEYDWDLLANKLNRRHTAHEYRCLWRLYFHPSINKSSWKNNEHNSLQRLATDNLYQNWDEIAIKLNTGRTGYQCFVYYRTNMTNTCIGKKWTPEEVQYLRRLVDYFREDMYIPWGKIAAAMENRTKIQIYNKYLRLIEQRKGRFLPEEDSVILNCVGRFGPNFRRVSEFLAHRSMVQIRSRYQVLSKMRVSTVWSVDDDRKLIQIMGNQDSNMTFSAATKFFPGRNRVNIRSRYITLIKWMKRNPNIDIEHAPRRGARRLNHGQASEDLNTAMQNLKNTLNAELSTKKGECKKITKYSCHSAVGDAIIAVLVNEGTKEREEKKKETENESVLVLPDETIVTNRDLNLTNLRKCLIFLSTKLNHGLYRNSCFREQYSQLGECHNDVSLITVKSYSKKNTVKTIRLDNTPTIWGNNILNYRQYVLPPHYASITACRGLMATVSLCIGYIGSVNLQVLIRKHSVSMKEFFEQLLERFYILFVWPMLLSNEGPQEIDIAEMQKGEDYCIRPTRLPQTPEVTIKLDSWKKLNNPEISEVIDVFEEEDHITITVPAIFTDNIHAGNNINRFLK